MNRGAAGAYPAFHRVTFGNDARDILATIGAVFIRVIVFSELFTVYVLRWPVSEAVRIELAALLYRYTGN